MVARARLNSIFVFFAVISSVSGTLNGSPLLLKIHVFERWELSDETFPQSGLETKITLTRTQIEIPFL